MSEIAMTYLEHAAKQKALVFNSRFTVFFAAAILAGASMGIGGVALFTLRSYAEPEWSYLVMRIVFITIVGVLLLCDGELFTSSAFVMLLGAIRRQISLSVLLMGCFVVWCGNLIGAASVAAIVHLAGGGALLGDGDLNFFAVLQNREAVAPTEVLFHSAICSCIICFSIWGGSFSQKPSLRAIAVLAPLTLFLLPGIGEHAVAKAFTHFVALFGDHPDFITWRGAALDIFWVTLGNFAGLIFFSITIKSLQFFRWDRLRGRQSQAGSGIHTRKTDTPH